jgi:hypothetical protein
MLIDKERCITEALFKNVNKINEASQRKIVKDESIVQSPKTG